MNVWSILGLQATRDQREIKRAYARKLKVTRPEDDPRAFQELRQAYEQALGMAQHASALDGDASELDEHDDRATVYTAAYEFEAEDERVHNDSNAASAIVYTAAYEFDPGPGPASATVEARRVWAQFIAASNWNARARLQALSESDELVNLEVRACFEVCAIQYTASEGCDDELRAELAAYFNWENDSAFIEREMPDATGETLARLRAHRSWVAFCELARSDDAAAALLESSVERRIERTANASFMQRIGELIEQIKYEHGEMLYFYLDRDVFDEWEAIVSSRTNTNHHQFS